MQFLKKLWLKPFCNDFHYFLIALVILFISFKFYYFFILLFIFLIFIYKKTKLLIPIIILLAIFLIRYYFVTNSFNSSSDTLLTGVVIDKTDKYIILKADNVKYLFYTNKDISIGDNITCNVTYYNISKTSYYGEFNYLEYLHGENIKSVGKITSYTYNSSSFQINILKYNVLSSLKLKLGDNTFEYVSALVFGENDLSEELQEGYSMLGIAHILAISGLHIILISKFLDKVIFKIFKIPNSIIPTILIGMYVIFLGFKPSVLRAFLFLLLSKLNIGEIKYTKLDILSISFIIITFIRPYMFYQSGFLLSFLVSFILIFMNEFVYSGNKIKRLYLSNIIIYFVTLPLTISFYNKISILSLLIGPVLSSTIIYLLLPLSFLSCFISLNLIENIFKIVNDLILGLVKYNYTITLPNFNIYFVIIYYIILLLILISLASKQKPYLKIALLVLLLTVIANVKLLNFYNNVTFLDCGQGDSCLIEFKQNNGYVLIDAYNSYDYLQNQGIDHLDYLVITHSDIDHLGDLDEIISKIDVTNVIYPKYDEVLSKYKLDNFIGVDYNYSFKINNITFDILSPIEDLDDVNSNSLVIKFKLDGYTYLFCGDIEEETEELLLDSNVDLSCDILKVAHHGSKTSSTEAFIAKANPDYSIISCKENNKYGFPDSEVYNRLCATSKVYITYEHGNITFRKKNNKLDIKTYY